MDYRKTGVLCAVRGCHNSWFKRKKYLQDICFDHNPRTRAECGCGARYDMHAPPKGEEARRLWLKALNLKKPPKFPYVCSFHFVDGRPTEDHPFPEKWLGYDAPVKTPRRRLVSIYKQTEQNKNHTGLEQLKENTTEQGVEEPQESQMEEQQMKHKNAKAFQEEAKDEINTEDTAQCSEELVIAKVEDLNDEMSMDVDQTEDHNRKMEVNKPEDAEKRPAKDIKNEAIESETNIQPMKLQVAQPSVTLPVNIKDEPMDDEYESASTTQRPIRNIKDEPDTAADFNQTPNEFKISAVFSVGGNSTSVATGGPAAPPVKAPAVPAVTLPPLPHAAPIGVACTGCKKVLLKGQTAFQRKGCSKLYCSPQCLCSTSTVVVKIPKKKTCHCCRKEIVDLKEMLSASDTSGALKNFCSQKCLTASNFRCSMCQKTGVTWTHEVNLMGSVHKLCSDGCFNQFRSSNKRTVNSCGNCGGFCFGTDVQVPILQIDGSGVKFCAQNCLTTFLKKNPKSVSCKMCGTTRLTADMVDSPNLEGVRELFCSTSCATANKVQNVSSSGAAVECNSCKKKLAPQYHLAMSDGTVQNFCCFSCVVSYQDSLSKNKSQNQINRISSISSNTPTPTPAAPKPALAESSSSTKTNTPVQTLTKIPCAQCLLSFFHKPELLEFKKKMYAFCGNSCIEEFKKINNIMARCEYCKIDKVVKEVKRINKIDRSFCSEGCKLLYKHDLVKRWGKKHCRNCFYCSSTAQTLVTSVIDRKQEEFCGNICLSQYNSLGRQEVKCTMCKQSKKMTETVKWLGEMKHFCSLQCLMFFCSLQGTTGTVTKTASKILSTQGTTPVTIASVVPQSAVNHTFVGTKAATPVIANVISLSSAPNGQPAVLGNTILQGSVPASTVKVTGLLSASTQTDTVKAPVPPPRILKNKALLCKPLSQNKGTSCKPNVCNAETQTEAPNLLVLPVPVPIYIPVPMHLYSQYTPHPLGLPLPVPVPLFFPTTLDSAESIVKTIQEIKEKIPDDPLEADLIMMAEMVAEDTEEKCITEDQTAILMDDLDLEALSHSVSWEEDSVSSAQTWDQTPDLEKPSLSKSDALTSISTPTEELQMDLEADFPVESIERLRGQTQQEQQVSDNVKRRPRRRGRDGLPQKTLVRKSAEAVAATSAQNTLTNISKLQHEYGVSAWKDWVHWRNNQPHMETPKFGSRSMTLKEDLLKCSTAELSYGLSKFISEVHRPNGEKYSPDSIFYLCLGIQQHLFENDRTENIFADIFYSRFCQDMTNMLKGWTPTILPSGYVHSRVEEEYLWDCKQLGAFSPVVLLNTLLYFFTKFFNYRTVEQHRGLSFGYVIRCSRTKGSSKEACLRFYPPKEDTNTDGVPAKRRKEEDDDKESVLEIKENSQNPLRCPIRLYEFYLSKCSPSVRNSTAQFYLSPERSCVPNSPMWFSTSSLSDEVLESMLTRFLTVRELHLDQHKSSPETESDSDSD